MIFEFGCPNCNRTFEVNRPIGQAEIKIACECGAPAHRLYSRVGIVTHAHGRIGKYGGWCDSLPGKKVFVKNQAHFRELCKIKSREGAELTPRGLS